MLGQEPAWTCAEALPLPPTTWTLAEAAKAAKHKTIHVGKWHLGDFFPMAILTLANNTCRPPLSPTMHIRVPLPSFISRIFSRSPARTHQEPPPTDPSFAYAKWPVSHPGIHGYDTWHATEASASSSTPNCGCDVAWTVEGKGCVIGDGVWKNEAFTCTNYW